MEEELRQLAYRKSRERRAVQAHLDQTKFDITSHVKSEAMIDQSVLMPEFFAPFPVSKGYVDVEIQFTPNKPEQDAAAQQLPRKITRHSGDETGTPLEGNSRAIYKWRAAQEETNEH